MTWLLKVALLLLAGTAAGGPEDSLNADPLPAPPPAPAPPAEPAPVFPTSLQVAIEQVRVADIRLRDTLEVTLTAHGFPIAGYAFKIAVDDRRVQIVEVLPGALYDTCRWEYFTARPLETPGRENYPRLVWNAVALAQFIPDSTQPRCYTVEGEASLLRLVVSNEHLLETDDGIVPIYFFWENCGDNTLSDRSGNTLILSRRVIDYSGNPPDSAAGAFPNRTGAPRQCVDPAARNQPKRLIDFHNGAVEFRLDLTADTLARQPDSAGSSR